MWPELRLGRPARGQRRHAEARRPGASSKAPCLPPSAPHPQACGCFYKSLLICGSHSGSVLTAYPCSDEAEERSNFGTTVA